MDDSSGVRGARRSLAIAFTLFTALVALFWVLPKSGSGGALWLLTLPAALLFPYFSYRVIAPRTALRTTKVAITMIVVLVVLFFCGNKIASLALPDQNLSGAAAAMMTLTAKWRTFALVALLAVGTLKLLDRSPSDSPALGTEPVLGSENPVPGAARASGSSSEQFQIGAISPSPLVQTQPVLQPDQAPLRPLTTARPAAVLAPTLLARSAHGHAPQESSSGGRSTQSPAQAPRTVRKTATMSGASFFELTTLVEVATSLSDPGSPISLLLSTAPDGLGLAAGGTDLGTVKGTWSGADSLPVRLSAHEMSEVLANFSPPPKTLSILMHFGDKTAVEFCDDRSGRRFILSAI